MLATVQLPGWQLPAAWRDCRHVRERGGHIYGLEVTASWGREMSWSVQKGELYRNIDYSFVSHCQCASI